MTPLSATCSIYLTSVSLVRPLKPFDGFIQMQFDRHIRQVQGHTVSDGMSDP